VTVVAQSLPIRDIQRSKALWHGFYVVQLTQQLIGINNEEAKITAVAGWNPFCG
jgi:hypothetical protein